MKPYPKHESVVALLNRSNVDTDQIIPKQFLKEVKRTGFGVNLFYDWRYNADGSKNLEFELNNPAFKNARILLTGDNFGCGSSREHAPWAIEDYGINTIISTSYADIFYNNCFKNGILPIVVTKQLLNKLMKEVSENEGVKFVIDLEKETISTPGNIAIKFSIDEFRKDNLLKGLDDISLTLQHVQKIDVFEEEQQKQLHWLYE